MKEETKIKMLFLYMFVYIIIFAIFAIYYRNYEFIFYIFITTILVVITYLSYKHIRLSYHIIFGLAILGSLHILGGSLHIGQTRLYDFWLIKGIFRYDHLVHSFAMFISTFVAYNILGPRLDFKIERHPFFFFALLVLIALGIGAVNEILELFAVVFLGAANGVGDYMNNALDLLFNLIGSIIASIFVYYYHVKGITEKV